MPKRRKDSPVIYKSGEDEAILYYEKFPICILKALPQAPEKDLKTRKESVIIIKLK